MTDSTRGTLKEGLMSPSEVRHSPFAFMRRIFGSQGMFYSPSEKPFVFFQQPDKNSLLVCPLFCILRTAHPGVSWPRGRSCHPNTVPTLNDGTL